MEFSVGLQDNFIFKQSPIVTFGIIAGVVIFIAVAFIVVSKILSKPVKPVDAAAAWKALSMKERNELRLRYFRKIDALTNQVVNGQIDTRTCYYYLSLFVREFLSEFTGVKVSRCTLNEIQMMNVPALAALINEFYAVEFDRISVGDELQAIEKTKWIIREWNI